MSIFKILHSASIHWFKVMQATQVANYWKTYYASALKRPYPGSQVPPGPGVPCPGPPEPSVRPTTGGELCAQQTHSSVSGRYQPCAPCRPLGPCAPDAPPCEHPVNNPPVETTPGPHGFPDEFYPTFKKLVNSNNFSHVLSKTIKTGNVA